MNITKEVEKDIKALIEHNLEHWKSYIDDICEHSDTEEDCDCLTNCLTVGIGEAGVRAILPTDKILDVVYLCSLDEY